MDSLPFLTPFDPTTMIESLDERGSGLRVAFFKPASASDRYGHVIATVENAGQAEERVIARLLSGEGMSGDGWPMSPPLQSLSVERRPEGAVALLVGMSGQHHWSASVEATPSKRRLIFDVACRVGSAADWRLSSLYLANSRLAKADHAIDIELAGDSSTLTLAFGEELKANLSSGGFGLQVKPTSTKPVRWKYVVELR